MNNDVSLASFTDILGDVIANSQESQPLSVSSENSLLDDHVDNPVDCVPRDNETRNISRPAKGTGQYGQFRSVDEIDLKYRSVFSYPFFNVVQSSVIEDALYTDKSMVVCAPTGSGKTVVFEMAIVQLLMELEDKRYTDDFKIIYMAPVKALCTERLTEWYPKFTKLGLLCIAVTGDTDVDFSQLKPYRIIITTPEKWDMVTRRWREHSQLVEVIKLFLIDEVHILNDQSRGPVLEAVVSRMKTIESSAQSVHRIVQLQRQYQGSLTNCKESPPKIRFVAVSATVSNPDDVAAWLGTAQKPSVYYKFGDESRPVKLKRIVEGYPCPEGTSIFKFDIILNYKLWPVIQKHHNGKPTLIFCNTRKSVTLTAETLSRELTVSFSPEQKAKLTALASTIKTKKLQMLVLSGVGCHHAGLLYEERTNIEQAFRNRDLPILITTTTLAMGVNLPAHLVIIKNTQQYVNGAYQEYSVSTILQMVGRAGRPQYDTEATAVIMTRLCDKQRYQALVGGSEPLQSYLHKRLAENLNSEAALGTVNDVAQCVQWVRSTFLNVRAARDPKRYLGLPQAAPQQLITKKIEELCVKAMNGLASSGLITMDEASCIESTEAGRLMSIYYLDLETMKHIMKINGSETLERLLWVICESHELADMHLRVDERRCLNTLNRNNAAATIRFPMKGKITTRQMKLNCIIQAVLGCLNIPDPSLNQEAMKIMRIADRICKCLVAYVTRPALISQQPKYYSAVLNALLLAKCIAAHLWENSSYVSKQLKGIGPTFSTLLATAGKVNFMLLEESHPRDLERIMNRGPPAGNILRKQVSLLPKYHLTTTPVDENSVTIQLALLNQNHLSENMEQLTAGDNHKSYVLVGDSENNLLMLTSFKDKDLASVYDGVIAHQITRKQSFEHKLFVHCISSSFVGIDAQCEYLFKDLEAVNPSNLTTNKNTMRNPATKQTNITDTFKERKRKNASENDIAQSKEKKKRDNALLEKFKSLKELFGKTSKELREDLDKSTEISNQFLQEFTQMDKLTSKETVSEQSNKRARIEPTMINSYNSSKTNAMDKSKAFMETVSEQLNKRPRIEPTMINSNKSTKTNAITEKKYSDEMDDEKIQNILIEIENEISKCNKEFDLPRVDFSVNNNTQNMQSFCTSGLSSTNIPVTKNNFLPTDNKARQALNNTKKYSRKNKRSNYNFIDLLNKNMNLSDEEDELVNDEISAFSDTIKSQIDKYLQNTKNITKVSDIYIADILEDNDKKENTSVKKSKLESEVKDFNANKLAFIENIQENEPTYEEKNNINEVEIKTIEHLSQSQEHDTNKAIFEVMNDNCLTEAPNRCLDFNTNTPETPHETQSSSLLTNDKRFDDKNQKSNKCKFLKLYDDPNSASGNNEATNRSTHLISYSDNSQKENRTAQNTIEFPTPLVPYTTQCEPPKFLENFETQNQIICQANTVHSRTDLLRKQPQICDSNSEQIVLSSENSPSSNNSPKSYNQNSNIRKYSYSATKIDVATRENHVTVIRKIKMDVDITEITSQKNRGNYRQQDIKNSRRDDRYNYTQGDRHNYNLMNPQYEFIDLEVLEPLEDKENKTDIMPYYRQQNVNTINISKKDDGQCYMVNPEIKCKDFKILEPHIETENNDSANNELINKDIQNLSTKQNHEEAFLSPKLTTTPSLSQATFHVQSKQTALMASKSIMKVDDVADKSSNKNKRPQNESNRLGSILQKYSKILRKDNAGNLCQAPTQSKTIENNSITAIPEKPKRPFKITDIDRLKTPLTKLQLSEIAKRENLDETLNAPHEDNMHGIRIVETQNKEFIYSQDELQNENIPKSRPKETWQDFSQTALILNFAHNEDIADNIEENLSKFKLQDAAIEELESCTETDFNIHQSMFNPKTLLQCFSEDEADIVVPPPPEFCDDTELPPQEDVTIPMECYEPMHWDIFSDNNPKERSIQDDYNIELTPRKEIETWTLSQNDESNQNLAASASLNTRQPFTIMHTPRQRNTFQNVSLSKQNKLRLEQFKISPKKILGNKF